MVAADAYAEVAVDAVDATVEVARLAVVSVVNG